MLELSRVRAGHWEGIWAGAEAPDLQVVHLEKDLPDLSVAQTEPGKWALRLPIPAELLSDGVQTFLIRKDGETLTHFTLVTGEPLEEDLRAEIDLLRAELDMLKRAFRRHCVETGA
ncbi:hypothetical protein CKO11_14505 [Rhodobacter sp. TJ_12]|uniref:hypothetical protein n=1 Tax=Rhodobacter sp. TJ_12 TaxID=2029399 RepID=UPI001CC19940|nr:hypothetical protein [Rhodobacter sp. TJ_12]MBZ4023661.1 hypothetical protein [Rhodobacter sp. TJ_12]